MFQGPADVRLSWHFSYIVFTLTTAQYALFYTRLAPIPLTFIPIELTPKTYETISVSCCNVVC